MFRTIIIITVSFLISFASFAISENLPLMTINLSTYTNTTTKEGLVLGTSNFTLSNLYNGENPSAAATSMSNALLGTCDLNYVGQAGATYTISVTPIGTFEGLHWLRIMSNVFNVTIDLTDHTAQTLLVKKITTSNLVTQSAMVLAFPPIGPDGVAQTITQSQLGGNTSDRRTSNLLFSMTKN